MSAAPLFSELFGRDNKPTLESFDRILASHLGATPLIQNVDSSRNSSVEHEEIKTPSYAASIQSNHMMKGDTERALKLQELYTTLSNLYIDPEVHRNQARDSQSSSNPSNLSISPPQTFEELVEYDSAEPSPTSCYSFSEQQQQNRPSEVSTGYDFQGQGQSRRATHELARRRLRESKSDVNLAHQARSTSHVRSESVDRKSTERKLRQKSKGKQTGEGGSSGSLVRSPSVTGTTRATKVAAPPVEEISFHVADLPDVGVSDNEARDLLARVFPQLCEAPARMFGEDGQPLPPTKKEETTPEERQARKEALVLSFCGKRSHSLIKSMVILESRSASWKRVGSAQFPGATLDPLPPNPNPWTLDFFHQDLEKLRSEGKAKRAFELTESKIEGQCNSCHGKRVDVCQTCKGEEADECWWCSGTGKKKNLRDCERCVGQGKLQCQVCDGQLKTKCVPCNGEGNGTYSIIVHIRVRRIDFPPAPISLVLPNAYNQDASVIQEAAIQRTKGLIQKLITVSNAKAKHPFRPLTASCAWEVSTSSLVEVQVPQAAKMLTRKSSFGSLRRHKSSSSLRPAGFHSKIATATRYYILPSDPDLRPAEMTKEEFQDALYTEMPITSSDAKATSTAMTLTLPVPRFAHSNELSLAATCGPMTPLPGAFRTHATPMAQMSLISRPSTPSANPGTPFSEVDRHDYFAGVSLPASTSSPQMSTSPPMSSSPVLRSKGSLSSIRSHQRSTSTSTSLGNKLLASQHEKHARSNLHINELFATAL